MCPNPGAGFSLKTALPALPLYGPAAVLAVRFTRRVGTFAALNLFNLTTGVEELLDFSGHFRTQFFSVFLQELRLILSCFSLRLVTHLVFPLYMLS